METILLAFYALVLVGFVLFILVVEKYKRRAVVAQERTNHLDDVLASAPEGFYLETQSSTRTNALCSRRLCLMLNLIDPASSFDTVCATLSTGSCDELTSAWKTLKDTGIAFELVVQNSLNLMHFKVRGAALDTPYTDQQAFVLWVENISHATAQFTQNTLKQQRLMDERDIFHTALSVLPFPLSIEHPGQESFFQNTARLQEAEDPTDIHWQETPFTTAGDTFLMRYGQDKATEEGLSALLADTERAHHATLKELPCALCLFDSTTRLTFYNKAFVDLWHLEPAWLKKEPFYDEFLNKLQEKSLLPQVKDFAQYKKIQKDLFARLTKPFEDFIYLPGGRIIRRLMIPHARGGILFVDEPKNTGE